MTTPHVYPEWIEFSHVFLFKRKASNSEENTENGEGYQIATKWHHLSSFNLFLFVTQLGKRDVLDWATGEATRVPFHAVV